MDIHAFARAVPSTRRLLELSVHNVIGCPASEKTGVSFGQSEDSFQIPFRNL